MSVGLAVRQVAGHSMRAYYVALLGGAMLVASAFLPWLVLGETAVGGVPDVAGLWVLGLGLTALLLASLSIYTRKNSRHPLLLVGLVSLGILILANGWMKRVAVEQAWARSQAVAIVDHVAPSGPPAAAAGRGVYLGIAGAALLVLFGLTIVVRRAAAPYAAPEDDDV